MGRPWTHVSFSGCGWLFTWHLGAAKVLLEAGKIARKTTRVLGTSGGSIPALSLATGLSIETAYLTAVELRKAMGAAGPFGMTDQLLSNTLKTFFPSTNAHLAAQDGGLALAVTPLRPRPHQLIVEAWHSPDDLFECVRASAFIPRYSAPRNAILFRGVPCVDGGLFDVCPPFPSHPETVRISPFPDEPVPVLGRFDVCPSYSTAALPRAWASLLRAALNPTEDDLRLAFDAGQRAAERALQRMSHERAD